MFSSNPIPLFQPHFDLGLLGILILVERAKLKGAQGFAMPFVIRWKIRVDTLTSIGGQPGVFSM